MLLNVVAQSDRWDLPNGKLLETVLSSCQVEKTTRGSFENEQLICPTRVPGHAFPLVLRDAVIASEDQRFFSHGALDFRSTLRAAWHSLRGNLQGGSTIGQQLARSLLLKKEDSFERKLLEAVLAVRIAAILSREEILARYMNAVPHARNMSGFDNPARYYFGIAAPELNLAEAALLVGMLPEPNNRDPLKSPADAYDSALGVLQRMQRQRKITAEQAEDAAVELKRRVFGGRLRRGDQTYVRLEYRPYRDLARREAKVSGVALPPDYRLILFIDPEFQRALLGQVCAVGGRHQSRAQLADDPFPSLGVRADRIERQRLEVQSRDLLGLVVAVEADPADHGGLPLALVAHEAAAGRKRASQCHSSECPGPGPHGQYPPPIPSRIEGKL